MVARWGPLHEGLWLDELHSAWAADSDWAQVAPRAQMGNQSPLYFYLLKAFLTAGSEEWNARLPSLISCFFTISLLYVCSLRATNSVLIASSIALVFAVDPKSIFYGTEARPYALVQLVALLSVLAFTKCLQQPIPKWRFAWVGGCIGLCYLHYTAVVIPAATLPILCWLKLRHREKLTYAPLQYACDLALVVLVTIPLWTHMFEIAGRRQQWAQFVTAPEGWAWLGKLDFDFLVLAPLVAFAIVWVARSAGRAVGLTVLGQTVLGQTAVGQTDRPKEQSGSPSANSIGEWTSPFLGEVAWGFALLPVAVVYLIAVTESAPIMLYRYLIVVPPMAILGWTLLTRGFGPWARLFFCASVLVYCTFGMGYGARWQAGKSLVTRGEDWSEVAQQIRDDRSPLLLRSGYIEANGVADIDMENATAQDAELVEYCLGPLHGLYDFGGPRLEWPLPSELPDYDVEPVARLLADHNEAWIILRIPRKRYKESLKWTRRLIAARGGGKITSKQWHAPILLVRVRFRNTN
jgi:hypothetical protein